MDKVQRITRVHLLPYAASAHCTARPFPCDGATDDQHRRSAKKNSPPDGTITAGRDQITCCRDLSHHEPTPKQRRDANRKKRRAKTHEKQ